MLYHSIIYDKVVVGLNFAPKLCFFDLCTNILNSNDHVSDELGSKFWPQSCIPDFIFFYFILLFRLLWQYGDTMTNIVVVQFSDYVQTSRDKRYNLTCLFRGPGEAVVTSSYMTAKWVRSDRQEMGLWWHITIKMICDIK